MMIVLSLLFAILVLVFLAVIIYRGYLQDEAVRQADVRRAVHEAMMNESLKEIKDERTSENGKS